MARKKINHLRRTGRRKTIRKRNKKTRKMKTTKAFRKKVERVVLNTAETKFV